MGGWREIKLSKLSSYNFNYFHTASMESWKFKYEASCLCQLRCQHASTDSRNVLLCLKTVNLCAFPQGEESGESWLVFTGIFAAIGSKNCHTHLGREQQWGSLRLLRFVKIPNIALGEAILKSDECDGHLFCIEHKSALKGADAFYFHFIHLLWNL